MSGKELIDGKRVELSRFILEGAEGRLSRLCFGGEEGNGGCVWPVSSRGKRRY